MLISYFLFAVGTGVSLKDIRNSLLDKFPELKEVGIHRDATHFLMAPPRKN